MRANHEYDSHIQHPHREWGHRLRYRRSAPSAVGCPARRGGAARHKGRLRCRGLWRLHGSVGRGASVRLPDAFGSGDWPGNSDGRGVGATGPLCLAGRVLAARRGAMRDLHARNVDGRARVAGGDPGAMPRAGRGRPWWCAVPLHGLRENRRCGDGGRAGRLCPAALGRASGWRADRAG
ncbi:hypothetical protein GALL_533590 [mine drainage metagenome]|uniref:Uncharacterized protein n=1 Tax=mine drainage metagenome TaxID=410659 RepID=A0A1J5PC58_9ZZZZ